MMRILAIACLLLASPRAAFAWSSSPMTNDLVGGGAGAQDEPHGAPDGAGGLFVAFMDGNTVRAQHLDPTGAQLWGSAGVIVCDTPAAGRSEPRIIADGAGGAFVAWSDARSPGANVYVQRLDAAGGTLWAAGGVAVWVSASRLRASQPGLALDDAGGVMVSYELINIGGVTHVGVQRFDSAGMRLWTDAGFSVGNVGEARGPQIAPDGAGGAYVVWYTLLGMYPVRAQRMSPAGAELWPADVTVSAVGNNYPSVAIAQDGTDGLFVIWTSAASDLYAQYLDASGTLTSTVSRLITDVANVAAPTLARVSPGLAVAGWKDGRDGMGNSIFAQVLTSTLGARWPEDGVLVDRLYTFATPQLAPLGPDVVFAYVSFDLQGLKARRVALDRTFPWGASPVLLSSATPDPYFHVAIVPDVAGAVALFPAPAAGESMNVFAKRVDVTGVLGDPPVNADAGVEDAAAEDAASEDAASADAEAADAEAADAEVQPDATAQPDAEVQPDATAQPDAQAAPDAQVQPDAAPARDAGTADAGEDGGSSGCDCRSAGGEAGLLLLVPLLALLRRR